MTVLAATHRGLYRVTDGVERTLDAQVREVTVDGDDVFAATDDGLHSSTDCGRSWQRVDSPTDDVHSVAVTGDGLFAGARPLGAYRRSGGEWTELTGLRDLADREGWPTPSFRDEAWARSLAVAGDRLLVAVEVGGLAVRDADGTWRSVGLSESDPTIGQRRDDVHQVAVQAPDEWVLATGDGVYRTTDRGESWARLDTGVRRYTRAVRFHDGRLFAGVNDSPPRWLPPDAAVYAGRPEALGSLAYPGEPERFVISWGTDGDVLYAGANDGAVLRVTDEDVQTVASVPVTEDAETAYGVRSLAVA